MEIGLVAMGADGDFYSTSPNGGKNNDNGTIFKISAKTHQPEVLYSFDFTDHGGHPLSGLSAGRQLPDGKGQFAIEAAYYGATYTGGLFTTGTLNGKPTKSLGTGTIFKFTPGDDAPEIIHVFRNGVLTGIKPEICPDKRPCRYSLQQRLNAAAGYPISVPVRASDNELYGVTSSSLNFRFGILYKVVPYRGESAITALCIGGPLPSASVDEPELTDAQLRDRCMFSGVNGNNAVSLIADPAGDLYGTTYGGGAGSPNGTVFRATLAGTVTTLHNFTDPKTGSKPYSVTLGSDGFLYGATMEGGYAGIGNPGYGVLYRLSKTGQFEILYRFYGTWDGNRPVSGLVEGKTADGTKTYFYGSAKYGGKGARGVLYRISTQKEFDVVYDFPNQWQVSGRIPSTTMIAVNDATYGLTLYGMTYQGGTYDAGTFFRLSGLDLPRINDLPFVPTFSTGTLAADASFTLPGQRYPTRIEVYTGVTESEPVRSGPTAGQLVPVFDNGIKIRVSNCRNPHVLQFVYREKLGADGVALGGDYKLSNGIVYPFTTNAAQPAWRTDTGYPFDGYYDMNPGVRRLVNPLGLTIFDAPSFATTRPEDIGKPSVIANFIEGAHETWRVTFKDYVICNCQIAKEIHWSREVKWIVDLPSAPDVTVDINKGHQGPPTYGPVTIVAPTDPVFEWANEQLTRDGFPPVP